MKTLKRVAIAAGLALLGIAAAVYVWLVFPVQGAIYSVETAERVVALTFDDGPYPPFTERLLDLLAREEVRVTFFVTGSHVRQHRGVARRAATEGHELANHGWDATQLAFEGPETIASQLAETDREIAAVGGPDDPHFRPGQGLLGLLGWREISARPGALVLGSGGANDWVRPEWRSGDCPLPVASWCPTQDAERIAAEVLASVRPGAIIVLHDGYAEGPGADRSGTVEAVANIVPSLRARGYRFVTVSELLELAAHGN